MARIDVVDPYSGATINVEPDSPQARAWGLAEPADADAEPAGDADADPTADADAEPEKRKPGRPKKS